MTLVSDATSVVIQLLWRKRAYVVKAADEEKFIRREIAAYSHFTRPLAATGNAARIVRSDAGERLIVLQHLRGVPATDCPETEEVNVYELAGDLLRRLHAQRAEWSAIFDVREQRRALQRLHMLRNYGDPMLDRAHTLVRAYQPVPQLVVPTHGDWHPRNWLVDGDTLKLIDFGNFAFRPATADFVRMALTVWSERSHLEQAFLRGYGKDPRTDDLWRISNVRESIRFLAWAVRSDLESFERLGRVMLARSFDV